MTKLTAETRNEIGDTQFAFPAQRKEPLENATHVRNAVSRFNQVRGVSDSEKDAAWQRILDAAGKYDVNVSKSTWRDLPSDH
jgi:Zn-dependent membrane protease YugP